MTETPELRISWSRLRVHEECRMKSHLLRSGHRDPKMDLRGYFHGMVVDQVMREWLNNSCRSTGDMVGMVEDMIDVCEKTALSKGDGVVRWRSSSDKSDLQVFCTDLVKRLEPILDRLVLPYPFEMGKRFEVPATIPYLDGSPTRILLTGEMDLLVNSGGWVVWDLKGTRNDSYWRKVLGQLIFYDLAVLALHNQRTRLVGFIQPMCTESVLEFVISDEDRRTLWARIVAMASQIWAEDIACKDGSYGCFTCEVRHACPRYAPGGSGSKLAIN